MVPGVAEGCSGVLGMRGGWEERRGRGSRGLRNA